MPSEVTESKHPISRKLKHNDFSSKGNNRDKVLISLSCYLLSSIYIKNQKCQSGLQYSIVLLFLLLGISSRALMACESSK